MTGKKLKVVDNGECTGKVYLVGKIGDLRFQHCILHEVLLECCSDCTRVSNGTVDD